MFLIDSIFLSPIKSMCWLAGKINEVAARELSDEDSIKEKLMRLQLRFELDEINEEEYNKQEEELLAYFDTMKQLKEGEG